MNPSLLDKLPIKAVVMSYEDQLTLNTIPFYDYYLEVAILFNRQLKFEELSCNLLEIESTSVLPCLFFIYFADHRGLFAWETLKQLKTFLQDQSKQSYFIILSSSIFPCLPTHLFPMDGPFRFLELETSSDNLYQEGLRFIYYSSLFSPESLYTPRTFHSLLNCLSSNTKTAHYGSRFNAKEIFWEAKQTKYTLPCFNIRSLPMIAPIMLAAKQFQLPVILEVSPVEIIRYFPETLYRGVNFSVLREKIFGGLLKLRQEVNRMLQQLEIQSPVLLHLDHATSPELVEYALSIGYDMVMYDGSMNAFNTNLRLSHELAKRAHQRGALIEAELGSVDRLTPRTTQTNKAIEFLQQSQVDLLGISAGQKHGSDYNLENLLQLGESIHDLQHKLSLGENVVWLEALETLLTIHANTFNHQEKKYLKNCQKNLLRENSTLFLIENLFMESADFDFVKMLLWRSYQLSIQRHTRQLKNQFLLFKKLTLTDKEYRSRKLDWLGIADIHNTIHAHLPDRFVGIVLHGGSSIDIDDLPLLGQAGINKINFGSSVFVSYVSALLEHFRPELPELNDKQLLTNKNIRSLLNKMDEEISELSIDKMIEIFSPFIDYLHKHYFFPLYKNITNR